MITIEPLKEKWNQNEWNEKTHDGKYRTNQLEQYREINEMIFNLIVLYKDTDNPLANFLILLNKRCYFLNMSGASRASAHCLSQFSILAFIEFTTLLNEQVLNIQPILNSSRDNFWIIKSSTEQTQIFQPPLRQLSRSIISSS